MSNTIDDFRRFIKPSSMKITFDIKNAIQGLLSVVNHSVKYNYITLKIIELNRGPFLAYGYPNEFKQCVLNIINNAKDGILKKRETNTTKGMITIELSSDRDFVHILVSDDGCGIDHAQLESIFDPFMSTKLNGDGFGLYMARLIIEDKMGGKIAAHPKAEGACIAISIPTTGQKEQDENFTT
jgi:two-component system, sporulation sensor kinase E